MNRPPRRIADPVKCGRWLRASLTTATSNKMVNPVQTMPILTENPASGSLEIQASVLMPTPRGS